MKTLESLFKARFHTPPASITPMAGAGSNRKYYRLETNDLKAVGVCGTSTEENRAFIYLSRHFRDRGLPMPEIYAESGDGMCYLQEDLGTLSLYDALKPARERGFDYGEREKQMLERVIRALPHLQTTGAEGLDEEKLLSPRRMDARAAMFDLNYFKYMFLRAQDIPIDELRLEDDMQKLAHEVCPDTARTFLYRDFQARNVMLASDGSPRFIDYQGGRIGPLEYDVASFLWQASARYPQQLKEELTEAYLDELDSLQRTDKDLFRQRLQQFVLLRTLQVLGAYGLRGYVERKAYFLSSIPPALKNLQATISQGTCDPYPYLKETLIRLCEAQEQ